MDYGGEEFKAGSDVLRRQTYWRLIAMMKIINDKKEAIDKNEKNLKGARKRSGADVSTSADAVQFEL